MSPNPWEANEEKKADEIEAAFKKINNGCSEVEGDIEKLGDNLAKIDKDFSEAVESSKPPHRSEYEVP